MPIEHEQYSIGVKAVIVRSGCVLILKRADHPVWELPGGRINKGETLVEALLREVAEELPGARKTVIHDIVHADQTNFYLPNGNRLMLLCFSVTSTLPGNLTVSSEHRQAKWATVAELDSLSLQPVFRQAVVHALACSKRR
jgi:8-oxo-dGTP diphosphatase